MMSIAVGANFQQSPARSKKRGELPADHDTPFRAAVITELQIAFDVVLEESADVARVVQIPLAKLFGLLAAEVLAQQATAFGETVSLGRFDEGNELPPPRCFFRTAQIFVGCAVTL